MRLSNNIWDYAGRRNRFYLLCRRRGMCSSLTGGLACSVIRLWYTQILKSSLNNRRSGWGASTDGIHVHHPKSYGYLVKAGDNVPIELLEKYDIPQTPVIYRGSVSRDEAAKHFVATVTALATRMGNLLRATNVPISMSVEEVHVHNAKSVCDMCKLPFTETGCKVADHCHLSGRLRYTLCSRVTVIPNSEENYIYISFSKRVMPDFSMRFLDSCRFMISILADLAGNLLTKPGDFEKFRETAKVFQPANMPLVTRMGVFPYEYTDKWSRLVETALPPKREFYSMLTE